MKTDETVRCLTNAGGLLADFDPGILTPIFTEIVDATVDALETLWQLVMGPDGIFTKMVAFVLDQIRGAADVLLPNMERFETFLASGIDSTCGTATETITNYVKNRDALKNVPKDFCSTSLSVLDGNEAAIAALLSTGLSWIGDEISALMNEHIWMPLIEMLSRLAITAQDSVAQLMVGLCGLIPEAGGPICMSITTPLTAIVGQLVTQLSSSSVKGFIDAVNKEFQAEVVPPLAGKAAEMLSGFIASVKENPLVKDSADSVTSSISDVKMQVSGAIQPVVDVAVPVLEVAIKSFFPKVTEAVVRCDDRLNAVAYLVKGRLCHKDL